MLMRDGEATDPSLIRRIGDWGDRDSWDEFAARYDRMIRGFCRGYGLGADEFEDLCQCVWIDLAKRMRRYQYDPGRRFRGWLRVFCRSRSLDYLKFRRAARRGGPVEALQVDPPDPLTLDDADDDADVLDLLRRAELVQEAVRSRVDGRSWRAFWLVAVEGVSFRDAAEELGMSYAAAFAAHKRVRLALRAEGGSTGSAPDGHPPETIRGD